MRPLSLLLAGGLLAGGPGAASALDFERCQIRSGAQAIDAECATLARPENPDDTDGKSIDLFVAKIPSRSPEPKPDALTLIQGGPGASSVDLYIGLRGAFHDILKDRDILLVDQRGTGRSNRLSCPLDEETISASLEPAEMRRQAERCLPSLDGDPRYYTTSIAVQDLEAVREAAGYPQLNVYGVSYGTRVAQHYLRRFPEQTRSVIIDGVAPVQWSLAGGAIARFSQAAFDSMASRCNEERACRDRFGDLDQKFLELRDRLAAQPVDVTFPDPISGQQITETIAESSLLMVVRMFPYATEQLALLPLLIDSAHAGNYVPLAAQTKMTGDNLADLFAFGMHNAVVCAEDVPFVKRSDLQGLDRTYFGSLMVDGMAAICEVWPRGPSDEDFKEPFQSDVPVLILSGETDPVTPPANGDLADQMFSNSRHLVVPAHGHGVIARGCVPQLTAEFVTNASFDDLDAECIERERAMPFFFDFNGPQP